MEVSLHRDPRVRARGGLALAIMITGSAGAKIEAQIDENTTLLRKPFQIADLTALVGSVLEKDDERGEPT